MKKEEMSLRAWLHWTGTKRVATKLGVDVTNVRQWKRGHCLPRTNVMVKIHKLSGGRVTYKEMIERFHGSCK